MEKPKSSYWDTLVKLDSRYYQARMNFFSLGESKLPILKKALTIPIERGVALRVIVDLKIEEKKHLFAELLLVCSFFNPDLFLAKQIIFSMPRKWVVENIEECIVPILDRGTYEEFRCLLDLLISLEKTLALKYVQFALKNEDADIKEVGEDFSEKLSKI